MRFSTNVTSYAIGLTTALALLLAGCGDDKPVGTVGYVKGFAGVVAADEPRAAMVASDVLSAGGSAADAAVALYFSLAVTLPSTASIGGGGVCAVYDAPRDKLELIDFRASPSTGPAGLTAVAVPANPRGFFALHAKFGTLRWESLLSEPERLAREGFPASRAFINDLRRAAPALASDPGAKDLFFNANGRLMDEGDRMRNHDLAGMLSSLRRAPGEMYAGQLARDIAKDAGTLGQGLRFEDLRDFRPQSGPGQQLAVGGDVALVSSAELAAALGGKPAATDGPPGTTFVVIDSRGAGVACSVSANALFGSARFLPGRGFAAAAAPGPDGGGTALQVNRHSREVHFAGSSSGPNGAAALALALRGTADGKQGADAVLAQAAAIGHADIAYCPSGSHDGNHCQPASDPNGFGYAIVVGKK